MNPRKISIGGNAHENWYILHLLPFIIGTKIPVGKPSWEILMDLKDIVELVVSPIHTEESIWYLDKQDIRAQAYIIRGFSSG